MGSRKSRDLSNSTTASSERGLDSSVDSGAAIAEFESLRQEIGIRITISYTLVTLELAALGTGLSLAGKTAQVLSGLAAISSLLWLYWIDNSAQQHRLGAYIALYLGPRMSEIEGHPALGWEKFLRKLMTGGPAAEEALFIRQSASASTVMRSHSSPDWYTSVLFGGSTPLLTLLFIVTGIRSGSNSPLIWAVAACVLLMWGYAVSRFFNSVYEIRNLSKAISLHRDTH
jgi:hypothetical protein